jgi:hypothetical protein
MVGGDAASAGVLFKNQVITGSQSHDDGSADRLRNDNAREIALFEVHHRRVDGVKDWTGEGCYVAFRDGTIALALEMETLIRAEIPLFAKTFTFA